jgi:hypothetical protein
MKIRLFALCALVLAVATLFAADVSGSWKVDGDVAGNPVQFECVLKQDGEKLSGTAVLQGRDTPMTGSVKEKTVVFEFDTDGGYHLVFTGTLADDGALKGSIEVAGASGTFTAKKQ